MDLLTYQQFNFQGKIMIKIVVDSASDITQSEAESLGVSLISMRVRFGEEEFSDGVDITHREFYEKLIESDALPQTSQINEFCWAERFDELLKDADEVLAITISSKLSGTYDSAAAAAKGMNKASAYFQLNSAPFNFSPMDGIPPIASPTNSVTVGTG